MYYVGVLRISSKHVMIYYNYCAFKIENVYAMILTIQDNTIPYSTITYTIHAPSTPCSFHPTSMNADQRKKKTSFRKFSV